MSGPVRCDHCKTALVASDRCVRIDDGYVCERCVRLLCDNVDEACASSTLAGWTCGGVQDSNAIPLGD